MSASVQARPMAIDVIVRLHPMFAGGKFRPVSWHALTDDGAELVGYGVEVKLPSSKSYRMAVVEGDSIRFGTKKEAETWCKAANEKAQAMLLNTKAAGQGAAA